MLRQIRERHELLWALTLKELKVRYKRATLGILWTVLNPLLQMAVLTTIFVVILQIPVPRYPLFLLAGLLPWTFLALGLTAGTTAIVDNGPLVKKVSFPRELLPVAAVLASLIHFLVALSLLLLSLAIFRPGLPTTAIVLPAAVILQFLLVVALALLTSGLNVRYRDTRFLVEAILTVGFYATPVLYPVSLVPEGWQPLLLLNPMAGVVEIYRSVLWDGTLPAAKTVLSAAGPTFLLLFAGGILFRRGAPTFADHL